MTEKPMTNLCTDMELSLIYEKYNTAGDVREIESRLKGWADACAKLRSLAGDLFENDDDEGAVALRETARKLEDQEYIGLYNLKAAREIAAQAEKAHIKWVMEHQQGPVLTKLLRELDGSRALEVDFENKRIYAWFGSDSYIEYNFSGKHLVSHELDGVPTPQDAVIAIRKGFH